LLALPSLGSPALGRAAPKTAKKAPPPKPKPPPPAPKPTAPTTIIDETASPPTDDKKGDDKKVEEKKKPARKPRVELAICAVEDLSELESAALLKLLKKCKSLRGKDTTTAIADDEMLVAVCVNKGDEGEEAIDIKECGLKATATADGGTALSLGADGDLALALRTSKLIKEAKPSNGTKIDFAAVQTPADGDPRTIRAPLIFQSGSEGYGNGRVIWFPLPMLTTDFSSSQQGYRLGITPIAVAAGWKWYPSSTSQGYFGLSAFLAWNLLVPNDTQTLSNGTFVRVNYKALGVGLLFDAAGYFAIGAGLGKTFTTDNRTDFRTWIYFGPKLLGGLNEF
jgi:hypothetical protein